MQLSYVPRNVYYEGGGATSPQKLRVYQPTGVMWITPDYTGIGINGYVTWFCENEAKDYIERNVSSDEISS